MRKPGVTRFLCAVLILIMPLTWVRVAHAELMSLLGVAEKERRAPSSAEEELDDLEPELAACFNADRSKFRYPESPQKKAEPRGLMMVVAPVVGAIAAAVLLNIAIDIAFDGVLATLMGDEYDWAKIKSTVKWSIVITALTAGIGSVLCKGKKILQLRRALAHPEAPGRIAKLLASAGEILSHFKQALSEKGIKAAEITAEQFRKHLTWFLEFVGGRNGKSAVAKAVNWPIGFAKGMAKSALTDHRLQHTCRHLQEAGLLATNWSKAVGEAFKKLAIPILEAPLKTFDHVLAGGFPVRGFHGKVNGTDVVIFIYKNGKYAAEVATSFVPSAAQMAKWGLL